eukprot:Gb_36734 [translate_table: standard]
MDTSNPAVMVNGEVIRRYIGRRVRCVLNVVRSDGGILLGQTSDGQQISVKQAPPAISLSQFVEVIGVAETDRTIRAETCTNFGDKFGRCLVFLQTWLPTINSANWLIRSISLCSSKAKRTVAGGAIFSRDLLFY